MTQVEQTPLAIHSRERPKQRRGKQVSGGCMGGYSLKGCKTRKNQISIRLGTKPAPYPKLPSPCLNEKDPGSYSIPAP